jgi:hypothetical protein
MNGRRCVERLWRIVVAFQKYILIYLELQQKTPIRIGKTSSK